MFGFWVEKENKWFSVDGLQIFATPDEGVAIANLASFEIRSHLPGAVLSIRIIGPDGKPK